MTKPIKIKLNIAGRYYPMSVLPDEEEAVRKAGKLINDMIKNFEQKYQTRDKQDALAMCTLQFAVKTLQFEKKDIDNSNDFNEHIQSLIEKIKEVI